MILQAVFYFYQTRYLNEEVHRTKPSISVSVPWLFFSVYEAGPTWVIATKHFLVKYYLYSPIFVDTIVMLHQKGRHDIQHNDIQQNNELM